MEFQEVVRRRRMIRRYRSDPIPEEAVERIVSAVLRGPTGGFSQGIDVIVITKPETRQRVVEALGDEPEPNNPLLAAPVQLIIAVDEERYHRRYNVQICHPRPLHSVGCDRNVSGIEQLVVTVEVCSMLRGV